MAKEIWQPGNMLYPIPAVMVSCQREGENPNIITGAWAGNVCGSPAMLSISVRKSRYSYDIIKETGEFVVYKNKADGSRAERYRGTDEEFAVVELYDRLQSEITNQKLSYAADMAERERTKYERNSGLDAIKGFDINKYPVRNGLDDIFDDKYEEDTSYSYSGSHSGSGSFSNNPIIIMEIILFVCVFLLFGLSHGKSGGYSGYNNNSGYNYNYDNDSNWNSDSWNNSDSWDSWGSDSWDSDSWDSGYTDWDSDW